MIFPFLTETTSYDRCFWQHFPGLHEAVEKLTLLRQLFDSLQREGDKQSGATMDCSQATLRLRKFVLVMQRLRGRPTMRLVRAPALPGRFQTQIFWY